jgi:hypothetical protein
MKRLRGTGTHNSPMNRDNAPRPQPQIHAGSGKALGAIHHGVPARVYGLHGGTAAPMGKLKRK